MFSFQEFINRLKNRGTLVLFLSVVFGVLVNLGIVDVQVVQQYQGVINLVIGILSGIGVIRQPYGENQK